MEILGGAADTVISRGLSVDSVYSFVVLLSTSCTFSWSNRRLSYSFVVLLSTFIQFRGLIVDFDYIFVVFGLEKFPRGSDLSWSNRQLSYSFVVLLSTLCTFRGLRTCDIFLDCFPSYVVGI